MNANGSNLHPVSASLTGATDPTWSPDGSRLAFTHADGTGSSSIGMINANGTGFTIHLQSFELDSYDQPAWSPDGSRTAYRVVSLNTPIQHNIAVMNSTGHVCGDIDCGWIFWASNHLGFDSAPSWSPGGTQLVFNRFVSPVKYVLRVYGPPSIPIDLTPGLTNFIENPAWSPDSARIIFGVSGLTDDLWTISAFDGSGLTQMTTFDFASMPDWQQLNTPTSSAPQTVTIGSAAMTFASVSQGGTTAVATSSVGPPPPNGFTFGTPPVYYDVTTSASITTAVVCITNVSITATSRLFHFTNGVPPGVDVTAAGYPDVANHRLCSVPLSSLSPFAIGDTPGSSDVNDGTTLATHFELGPARPNPSRGEVQLDFTVPREARVSITVYDPAGGVVWRVADGIFAPGRYRRA